MNRSRKHIFFLPILCFMLAVTGCKKEVPLEPDAASEQAAAMDQLFAPMTPLTTAELDAIGTVNNLPVEWVLPNAYFAQLTKPNRFMAYSDAAAVVRFLDNNPNLLLFSDQFDEIETMITGNLFSSAALLDPQTGTVVSPRYPFPSSSVYLKKTNSISRDAMMNLVFSGVTRDSIQKKQIGGKEVFFYEQSVDLPIDPAGKQFARIERVTSALHFPDDRSAVFVLAPAADVDAFFVTRSVEQSGPVAQIISRIDDTNADFTFLYYYNQPLAAMTPVVFPEPLGTAVGEYANYLLLSINATAQEGENAVRMVANAKDATALSEIQTALGSTLMTMANDANQAENAPAGTAVPAFMKYLDAAIKNIKTETDKTTLIATLSPVDVAKSLFAEFFSEVNKQHSLAQKVQQYSVDAERLFALGRVMTAYMSKNGNYPPLSINAPDGTPLLSWRVSLLNAFGPEGEALYKEFRLDEPWNGPNNIKLLDKVPMIYAAPLNDPAMQSKTTFRIFGSPDTPFGKSPQGLKIQDIANPARTLMIVSTTTDYAVEWTRPDSLSFEKDQLGEIFGDIIIAVPVMGDVIRAPFSPQPESLEKLSDLILGVTAESAIAPAIPVTEPEEEPMEEPVNEQQTE